MNTNNHRCVARASKFVPSTLTRSCAAVVVFCAAGLAGCSGHGQHTQAGVNAAQERLSLLKSGTEYEMAHQQFLAGDFDKAIRTIDKSISLNGKVGKSYVLRGRILIEKGQLELARITFLKAEDVDAKNVEAQYYLGIIHERFSQPELAYERYLKAAELDPANPQYLLAQAEMLVQLERLDEAQMVLEERRASFEFNAAVRQTLGHIQAMRGDTKSAAQLFNEALLLAPDDLAIMEDLVHAQVGSGQFAEAEFNLRRLMQPDESKDRRDLKHLHARCLMAVNRPVEARTILLALTGDAEGAQDIGAWIDLGNVACVLGDQARIKDASSRLMAIAPDRFEGYFLKAVQLKESGDAQGALRLIDKAVSLAGRSIEPLIFQGMIQQDLGMPEEAKASFAAAIEIDPDNATSQRLMAAVLGSAAAHDPRN